jgi:two-component system response regulator FixJ
MKKQIRVRTLVIDDDETVCRRLSGWLAAEAHEVATFTDPRAGLEQARQTACELPDAEGADVIGRLHELSPLTRIIALSAFPQTDQVQKAIRAGARDLIEKPIQRLVLLKALERQLAEIGIPARSEPEFNRRLGARLRQLRQDARRTQHEIAGLAGITPAQLSQIELGKTATSTWTLARIGSALKVRLASLFDGL